MSRLAGVFHAVLPGDREVTWTVHDNPQDDDSGEAMVELLTAALRGLQQLDPTARLELRRTFRRTQVIR